MSNLRLYIPPPWPKTGTAVPLDDGAVRHINVLRMQVGESIELFDGVGQSGQAVITALAKRKGECRLESVKSIDDHSPVHITLFQAFPKADKFDSIIQKTTELGIECVVPVMTERSAPVPKGERLQKKLDHWKKVAIEASRQSGRVSVPEITAPIHLRELKQHINNSEICVILHTVSNTDNIGSIATGNGYSKVSVLVGPEGGFSAEEISQAVEMGLKPTGCGPRIMRTETAGPAIVTLLQYMFGDLREQK